MKTAVFNAISSCFISACILIGCDRADTQFSKLSTRKTNIEFENTLAETMELNIFTYDYVYNGAGVALGDLNNDGLVDLYFSGNTVDNKLYLNKGDFDFEDITDHAGVAGHSGWKTGVTLADVNGDGWLDIYVCYSGLKEYDRANQLFINDGGAIPTFTEQAQAYGLDAPVTYSTQASFFDADNDGDLDLFLVNHGVDYHSSFSNAMRNVNKRHPEYGNQLFRNDAGKFTDISEAAGIYGGWLNYGLSATISDFNGDNFQDIYVSNDFDERDFLYVNNGDGTFSESLKESFGHISKFTMGTDAADINNDNLPDLITLDMLPEDNYRQKLLKGPDPFEKYNFFVARGFHHQLMRNMLQLNTGSDENGIPRFSEIGLLAGISMTDWSWAPLFADFDNDGHKDLFISNGYFRDFTNLDFQKYDFENARQQLQQEGKNLNSKEGKEFIFSLVKKMKPIKVSNYIFKNSGNLQFQNKTKEWGLDGLTLTNGAAYADLDNDGDLDLVTNNINEPAGVYRNNSEQLNMHNFLKVKVSSTTRNKFAVGSKIYVETDQGTQFLELQGTRGYLSSVDPILHFGLGNSKEIKNVKVIWSDGTSSSVQHPKINSVLQIDNTTSTPQVISSAPPLKIFIPVPPTEIGLAFKHQENPFIDFRSERLLLSKLSQQGPATTVGDVNNDGLEDIFVGGAISQSGKLFLQTVDGLFQESKFQPWSADKDSEDVSALLFDCDGDNDLDLYVVSGGNEYPIESSTYFDRLYVNDGAGVFRKTLTAIPTRKGGGSTVAAADYDHDGDLDLFVGGWAVPTSYPLHTQSMLLKNESTKDNIKFVDVIQEHAALADLGVLQHAIWNDYDQDGNIDLMVVGHWKPIRVFKNDGITFQEITNDIGFKNSNGFWNTIIAGDFDLDGDDDIVVGNTGLNGEFTASISNPIKMYWGDFDGDGKVDPIVSHFNNAIEYPIATRDELLSQVATMKKKYPRYSDYAKASLPEVLNENKNPSTAHVEVLHTMYFENKNGVFSGNPLPIEAQFAPVNAILKGDFNQDANIDILIGGNFKGYRAEYGPFDASEGLLLLGDGKGGFTTMHKKNSGIRITGDVRNLVEIKRGEKSSIFVATLNNEAVFTFGYPQ